MYIIAKGTSDLGSAREAVIRLRRAEHSDDLAMTRVLGVDFAPMATPVQRRIQTLGVLYHFFFTYPFSIFTLVLPILLVCSVLCVILLVDNLPMDSAPAVLCLVPVRPKFPQAWWLSAKMGPKLACQHLVRGVFSNLTAQDCGATPGSGTEE